MSRAAPRAADDPIVLAAHESDVLDLVFGRNGRFLASAGRENVIKIWAAPRWKFRSALGGHSGSVASLALSPNGRLLASGSLDHSVCLWSFPQGERLARWRDWPKMINQVAFAPDGEWVGAAAYGGRWTVWTLRGEVVGRGQASRSRLTALAFAPDGRRLAIADWHGVISLWALPQGKEIERWQGHDTAVSHLSWPREETLLSLAADGLARWSPPGGAPPQRRPWPAPPERVGFAAGGTAVLQAGPAQVTVQDLRGATQMERRAPEAAVRSLALAAGGKWLAAGTADSQIYLWPEEMGE
jgi:WD40 repeat protein